MDSEEKTNEDEINIVFRDESVDVAETDPSANNVIINMTHNVSSTIETFAASDTTKELGGILLGTVSESEESFTVDISGQVPAKYTEARQGSITFTHQSWEDMHAERDRLYPDLKIVGWYHTHPGFGIFLSSYDLFIQRNFFNDLWNVAYVVDPKAKKRGFFCWDHEKIVPAHYSVGGERVIEQMGKAQERYSIMSEEMDLLRKNRNFWRKLTLLLLVLFIGAVGFAYGIYSQKVAAENQMVIFKQQAEQLEQEKKILLEENSSVSRENSQLNQKLTKIKETVNSIVPTDSGGTKSTDTMNSPKPITADH